MKTTMMRYGAAILALSTMAGCSSSGGAAATSSAATSPTPPVVIPPTGGGTTPAPARGTGGTTVASAMNNGAILLVDNDKTASIEGHRLGGQTAAGGQDLQIRNNFLGGVDISIGGEIFYLKDADANADTSSWSQKLRDGSGNQTLTFWNAGKGGREGLFQNEDGQKYHKIVGFHHTDATGSTKQGHAIVGTPTSRTYMDRLSRQVDYTGYYYANVNPTMMTAGAEAAYVTGELKMVADFDEGTVKGTAKEVLVRRPGSLGAINYGDRMTFDGFISGANIQGEVNSTYIGLDGAEVDGAFYGNGAQEAAGVISGTSATGVTEGYFTVYDPKAK